MAAPNGPVLLVTNHLPAARVPAFAALHAAESIELALWGGRLRHGAGSVSSDDLPFPTIPTSQGALPALIGARRHRAVVAGTGGRLALPAAYVGSRRAGLPFVLWASLWAQPRSPAGMAGWPLLRHIYAHADAVATYGPHVSRYVAAHGARRVVEAPQAVDARFWASRAPDPRRCADFQVLFAGRLETEKGIATLLEAWTALAPDPARERLVLAGTGPLARQAGDRPAVEVAGRLDARTLRNFYAGSDVVVLPSLRTATFREPWGLVVNEAFSQSVPVIASDQVGAAAGGLVRHGHTGLIVPAGDPAALAMGLAALRDDPARRRQLGAAAARAVQAFTPGAWAAGVAQALRLAGVPAGTDQPGEP